MDAADAAVTVADKARQQGPSTGAPERGQTFRSGVFWENDSVGRLRERWLIGLTHDAYSLPVLLATDVGVGQTLSSLRRR